jgi:hypothetical protein
MSKKEKFQFGLRKLLLWMLVVPVWFSVLFLWTQETATTIAMCVSVTVAVLVRMAVGSWVAALAIIPMYLNLVLVLCWHWDSPTAFYVAFAIYVFVEVSYRVINLLDHLLTSKTKISDESEGSGHS